MKLQSITNAVTSRLGRKALVLSKHSPKIMFVAGVVGVGATVVLACRATLKVDEVLQEHEKTVGRIVEAAREINISTNERPYSEADRKRDLTLLYAQTAGKFARLYGPSIVVGVVSIALLTGAHLVLSRRNMALTAAYAALDKGFREYRQRVSDELGPDKERDLRLGQVEEEITDEGGNKKIVKTSIGGRSIYARCFDETSTSFIKDPRMGPSYNPTFLRTQQDWANDKLRANGWLTLNEVYQMLGLPKSKEGMIVGWVLDGKGDGYVDFGFWDSNQELVTEFILGQAPGIWINPNVDGVIYDQI
jgi:hypothetical protein